MLKVRNYTLYFASFRNIKYDLETQKLWFPGFILIEQSTKDKHLVMKIFGFLRDYLRQPWFKNHMHPLKFPCIMSRNSQTNFKNQCISLACFLYHRNIYLSRINPLSANPTKCSNTVKQNCLSVFDHFVGLAFEGLRNDALRHPVIEAQYALIFISFMYSKWQKTNVKFQ